MAQLGQLIMTGISGLSLNKREAEVLEKENIGGVLLFKHNYENPAQLAELVNSIQALRQEYPLFIAVDHEGGRVVRFGEPFTQFPSMGIVGKTDSPKMGYEVAKVMAEELAACGINVNFSPCCDVLLNPNNKVIGDRAFGDNAEIVSKFVSSIIRGLQTHSVMACAKHFPGHGSSRKDSHVDLPIVKRSLDDLRGVEFETFGKAIKSRVEFMMMAHLIVEGIDQDLPCSLSPKSYEVLRDELRYKKIIITDDMEMGAITKNFSLEEASFMALKAGADIVQFKNFESMVKCLESLKADLREGRLTHQNIQEKSDRVLETKKSFLQNYQPIYIPDVSKSFNKTEPASLLESLNAAN